MWQIETDSFNGDYIFKPANSDILNMGVSMSPPAYQGLPQVPINVNKVMRRQVEEAGRLQQPILHIYKGADKDYQKGIKRR